MYAYLFYGAMCLVILEMLLVTSPLMFLGLGLVGIILTGGLCIYGGLDLLGLALLATYASVFLFLSVLAMCMGGAWTIGGWSRWGSGVFVGGVLLLGVLLFYSTTIDPLTRAPTFIWQDHYKTMGSWGTSIITLIHIFFMRLFALEATLLNFYILVGLMACLAVVGLILPLGGGGRATHKGKAKGGLIQNKRIAAPSASRRSWRRRNASIVREIRWSTS